MPINPITKQRRKWCDVWDECWVSSSCQARSREVKKDHEMQTKEGKPIVSTANSELIDRSETKAKLTTLSLWFGRPVSRRRCPKGDKRKRGQDRPRKEKRWKVNVHKNKHKQLRRRRTETFSSFRSLVGSCVCLNDLFFEASRRTLRYTARRVGWSEEGEEGRS